LELLEEGQGKDQMIQSSCESSLSTSLTICLVKRPCSELGHYEVFNQSDTTLVDVNETPIVKIAPGGVKTHDVIEHELDVLILATGYDAVTGSIAQINTRGTDGVLVGDTTVF
jgi:hypothetical protein